MATRSDNNKQFRCSFCNKTQDQVRKLVAGPKGVYICDECIEVCTEIMEDELENFNEDRWNECAAGIHFFITREEAIDY